MPRTGKGPTDQSASAFLKACRETLELPQKKLAPLVGVSQQQISKYERGESSVPREVLKKVRALVGMSFEEFGQPEFPAAAVPGGFEAMGQASYTAESSSEAANNSIRSRMRRCSWTSGSFAIRRIGKACNPSI